MAEAVDEGIVTSLSHPGGIVTGVDIMSGELSGKRLELLAQLVPAGRPNAFLAKSSNAISATMIKDVERAARSLARTLMIHSASTDSELDENFAKFSDQKIAGLIVENDSYFDSRRQCIIDLSRQRSIPAIYHIRDFPVAGGLMSYGANLADSYHQMGVQVGRLLKGTSIVDQPVIRPTKFELVTNLTTAEKLAIEVPANVLAITDEVID